MFQSSDLLTVCEVTKVHHKLSQHNSLHRDLIPYGELMQWLKVADYDLFSQIVKVEFGFVLNLHKTKRKVIFRYIVKKCTLYIKKK